MDEDLVLQYPGEEEQMLKAHLALAGPGVILVQISDGVIKIKMGPRALPRIVYADRLRPYKGDETSSWITPTLEAEER